jgi:hypothetical protein
LAVMREAALLSVQAEGRYQRYRANIGHMIRLLALPRQYRAYDSPACVGHRQLLLQA